MIAEGLRKIRPDESCAAGDEYSHVGSLFSSLYSRIAVA